MIKNALLLIAALLAFSALACARECHLPITAEVFIPSGFGSNWSHANNLIAFNRKDADGLYHIFTIRPDGSHEMRFGAANPDFPTKMAGSPAWHPSGRYMAFVAEKEKHSGGHAPATPGWGTYSDLWLANADGSKVWQLTNTAGDKDSGTLIPEFSPDGKLLEWTERTRSPNIFNPARVAGYWVIKIADFIDDASGPHIANVRTFSPGGDFFNETGGFSADSSGLVFTSDFGTRNFWKNQIYHLDLRTQKIVALTDDEKAYNEHPRYTPSGNILWMSSKGNKSHGTDWWVMKPDGSAKTRVSYFNDKDSPEYLGKTAYNCTVPANNWSDDGSYFYGDVETSLLTSESQIMKVSLTCQ